MKKIGRNELCPCGSGKKYKKCCFLKQTDNVVNFFWKKLRQIEDGLVEPLLVCADKYYGGQAIYEAWNDFTLWTDEPMEPEENMDFATLFMSWFLYQWRPEQFDRDDALQLPNQTIALTYLENHANKLSQLQKDFVQAVCQQPYSFWVVTDVNPGKTLTLKDLFLGEQYCVHEQTASTSIKPGSILYCQVLTHEGTSLLLSSSSIMIPSEYYGHILDVRDYFEDRYGSINIDLLRDYDTELRQSYFDIKDILLDPPPPQLTNKEGHSLQPTKLHYQLNCSVDDAFQALKTLAKDVSEQDLLGNDAVFDKQGQLQSIKLPWLAPAVGDDVNRTVLGFVAINNQRMIIDINSNERAEKIKQHIAKRLGKRAKFKHAVHESIGKILQEIDREPNAQTKKEIEALQKTPEVQAMLKKISTDYWQEWINVPLPALKDQTPKQASKTKAGRERLEGLFMQFSQFGHAQDAFAPDVDFLKAQLNMDE